MASVKLELKDNKIEKRSDGEDAELVPLLSICIPTYNRAKLLDKTINDIVMQLSKIPTKFNRRVELCISDNCSTDETSIIMQKYLRIDNIRTVYNVNQVNVGPENNYLKAVEIAHGNYVWLIGSDDKIEDGGVSLVLQFIENHNDVDVVVLNHWNYIPEISDINGRSVEDKQQKIIFFQSPIEATKNVLNKLGLISNLCFKKTAWDMVKEYKGALGYEYIHVFKILKMIRNNCVVAKFDEPIIIRHLAYNDSIAASTGLLRRWLLDVWAYNDLPKMVFGDDPASLKRIFWVVTKDIFHPYGLAATVMNLSFRERLFFSIEFFKRYKKYLGFYIFNLPVLLFAPGSKGKILYLFKLNTIERKFVRIWYM